MAKNKLFETMPLERYLFEKERFGIDFRLSKRDKEAMKGWELERFEDDFSRSVVWRVTTLMAHGDRTVTATEDVPITWWDHVKYDINMWALDYLKRPRFFFTNIAKAIAYLPITPKFRRIESSILVKRFCPHVGVGDNRPHIEFMIGMPLNYGDFRYGGIGEE
jgi:hypothetical protein